MSRFLADRFQSLDAYTPGEQPTDMKYIKLNTNESPFPPSPAVLRAISEERVRELRLYSDPTCTPLRQRIAAQFGFEKENVFVSNGSDDILNFSFMAFCDESHPIVFPDISYGFYSVKMKAAKCPGVISSFFTYTGRPWDEIDIEFLGDDTTRVQFNYYTKGKGHHEYIYHLGFDASEDFHEYAFDWREDSITWYVDGKAVYKATKDIPTTPGQIMMNIWNVADSSADWAGRFDESYLPLRAEYQWIGYQSAD